MCYNMCKHQDNYLHKGTTMATYFKEELVSSTELAKRLGSFLDWVISDPFNKLAIIRRNKPEAVIVPIEEYERMVSMSEAYELEQIEKIIEERVTNRKTPAKMISHEEMMGLIEKRLANVSD